MDLSSVITSLASGTYTVSRHAPATYLGGVRVAGAATPATITASVQPLNGRDLQSLPEGMRTEELLAVWTATELKTQGPAQDPDSIVINGSTWEVQKVERWADLGNYWKAIVAKVGR